MMMDKTEVQLFDNDYKQRCETFGCGETSRYFVGRPDAPLSTALNLCQKCTDQLVESIVEMFGLHEKSVHANKGNVEVTPNGTTITLMNGDSSSSVTVTNGKVDIVADEVTGDFVAEVHLNEEENADTNTPPPIDNDIAGRINANVAEVIIDAGSIALDGEVEVTLEEILASVRTHAELDAVATELGVEGLPTRDEATLDKRKKYVLDYDFPAGE